MRGKTMAELAGLPSLRHIIHRLQRVSALEGIVVATTTEPEDDAIEECARVAGVAVYRGSAEDVLARTIKASATVQARTIVNITGDCPLVDPIIVARLIREFRQRRPDYASILIGSPGAYPRGMDAEIYAPALLQAVEPEARTPRDREHVTLFFHEHPEQFDLLVVEPPERHRRPELRLTLDTPHDYALISKLYEALFPADPCFGLDAVLDYLRWHPELELLNRHIPQVVP
jgi:spore coat polysaccharide biosynthesis protein SpsF